MKHKLLSCLRKFSGWTLVAHTCNPSYSGHRDQEDSSLKPPQANSSQDPILKKKSITKKALEESLKRYTLSSKPRTEKTNKQTRKQNEKYIQKESFLETLVKCGFN
jgi:hypothetical protein